ncbi:relaxase/mobilization nuclease domain-containing protein [Spirillospora sp. CA-294931]|uniref:relaxase/mobilization nuclease domain-containing protein n=1 Tax=Spirillospora sp. CA-294931 TaxID=3240042 RepID=UPI003D8A2E2D
MAQPLALLGDRNFRKPVWHVPVRAAPEDPVLSDAQWAEVAAEVMARTGLAAPGDEDAVRWIAVRHADDHIHIVATLARADGVRPEVWNDGYRVREACRAVEDRFGLRSTPAADRTAARRAKRGETEKAARARRVEPARAALRRHVQTAAAGAWTEEAFFDALVDQGVLVHKRFSQLRPDEVTGYAVALPDDRTKAGRPVWFGGGKLAADLTLPKLRHRWNTNARHGGPRTADHGPICGQHVSSRSARIVLRTLVRRAADQARTADDFFERLTEVGVLIRLRFSDRTPDQVTGYAVSLPGHTDGDGQDLWYSGGRLSDDLTWPRLQRAWRSGAGEPPVGHLTDEERGRLYTDALRAAAYATSQIRRQTVVGPHLASDACWAAADALRTAACATGNPHLKSAAEAYDRAARPPYGRLPSPTPAGNGLRTAARLLTIAGRIQGQTSTAGISLATGLIWLMDAMTQLHEVARHRIRMDASRAAGQHLRRAAPESIAPWFSAPNETAMLSFPHPWRPADSKTPPRATSRPDGNEGRRPRSR